MDEGVFVACQSNLTTKGNQFKVGKSHAAWCQMKNEDMALVKNILSGSRGSFDIFFERYFQKVYSYVFLKNQDHSETQDFVERAFVTAIKSLKNYEGDIPLDSWVYFIIRDVLINWDDHTIHTPGRRFSYKEIE